jgi:hypothetical protein
MTTRFAWTIAAGAVVAAAVVHGWLTRPAAAQARGEAPAWSARTAWGDPDLQGEWTSEGEYGVPFERPPQYGMRTIGNMSTER